MSEMGFDYPQDPIASASRRRKRKSAVSVYLRKRFWTRTLTACGFGQTNSKEFPKMISRSASWNKASGKMKAKSK